MNDIISHGKTYICFSLPALFLRNLFPFSLQTGETGRRTFKKDQNSQTLIVLKAEVLKGSKGVILIGKICSLYI